MRGGAPPEGIPPGPRAANPCSWVSRPGKSSAWREGRFRCPTGILAPPSPHGPRPGEPGPDGPGRQGSWEPLSRTLGPRGLTTQARPRACSTRRATALAWLLVLALVLAPTPGCAGTAVGRWLDGGVDLVVDATPPAIGAGVGALVGGPGGAALGAGIGVALDAAVSWMVWEGKVQDDAEARVVERPVHLPPTPGAVIAEWGMTILGLVVVAFLLGWLLLGPGEMARRWKAGRRGLRDLLGLDRRDS